MARAPLKSAGPKTVRAVKANEEWGSDCRRFLELGKTDEHGEDTVMTIDTDDTRFLRVDAKLRSGGVTEGVRARIWPAGLLLRVHETTRNLVASCT